MMENEIKPLEICSVTPHSNYDLIKTAIEQGYGAEALTVLERMLELQIKHDHEVARKAYHAAMAQAQSEMPVVPKMARNAQTNSDYAKYEHILRYCSPISTKHGFAPSFHQEDAGKEGYVRLVIDIMHKDGHVEHQHADIPIDDKGIKGNVNKTPTHAWRSSITYGKTTLYCNAFNISTADDVDDDGNGAGGVVFIEGEELEKIKAILEETSSDLGEFLKYIGAESIDKIPQSLRPKVQQALWAKKNKVSAAKTARQPGDET
jgi:hypothetical protein